MGKTTAEQECAHVVKHGIRLLLLGIPPKLICFFPQQRELMGSSAQVSSGVCRRGSQEQVPEEGSGKFPVCAGVSSGGGLPKVPECSGVCWCRFRKQVPESSGVCWCRFWRHIPESSGGSGRFRRVSEGSGVCWCTGGGSGGLRRVPARAVVGSRGRVPKVPESSGVVCCLATLTGVTM